MSVLDSQLRQSKKQVRLIDTGGTIASGSEPSVQKTRNSLLPPSTFADELRRRLGEQPGGSDLLDRLDLVESPSPVRKFSEDMTPNDWLQIASEVHRVATRHQADGIVIAHGTDTLAYTAAALSFLLRGIAIPVVLTGAFLPLTDPKTDGVFNLMCALHVAEDPRFRGVYVVFRSAGMRSSSVIKGTRVMKSAFPTPHFHSVNTPRVASVERQGDRLLTHIGQGRELARLSGLNESITLEAPTPLDPNVAYFRLHPGFSPHWIMRCVDEGMGGIVLDLYYTGTGPTHAGANSITDVIRAAVQAGIPVFGASQHGGSAAMQQYRSSVDLRSAGVAPLFDMSAETAVVKLMWLLGRRNVRNSSLLDVVTAMRTNFCGEVSSKLTL